MRDLRRRCEWDRAQTHESLRPYLIEEAYEVDDAIQQVSAGGDAGALRDELGDLLLQVVFHAVVAEERGAFDLHDVAHALVTKMRARHPHLYPPEGADAPAARPNWEAAKARTRKSIDQGLPAALPALHRAHRLQDRAAGVGFDWPDVGGRRATRSRRPTTRTTRASRPSWATCSSRASTCAARPACTPRSRSTRRTRSSRAGSARWSGLQPSAASTSGPQGSKRWTASGTRRRPGKPNGRPAA